jgi:hypothetical protein
MKSSERRSRTRWRAATWLLLTFCFLCFWATACKPRVVTTPVLIGDTRIVGKVNAGTIQWEAGENQTGAYYVVTPALLRKLFALALENSELRAEIKKLEAGKMK